MIIPSTQRSFFIKLLFVLSLVIYCQLSIGNDLKVLFTHDIHSHLKPTVIVKNNGKQVSEGGIAKISTLINQIKQESSTPTIIVDGGDFSMGSIHHVMFRSEGMELKLLGKLGYDVVSLGNHEFDFTGDGLLAFLNTISKSNEPTPQITLSNFEPIDESVASISFYNKLRNLGLNESVIIERGGLKIGIFGIFGIHCASISVNAGVNFIDPVEYASKMVDKLRNQDKVDIVVCLSHTGTGFQKCDDWMAKKVSGIDLIISGHTHTVLTKPMKVNNTWIVSAGCYGRYLGNVDLEFDSDTNLWQISNYELIPVSEDIQDDENIQSIISDYEKLIDSTFLSQYNYQIGQEIAYSPFSFPSLDYMYENRIDNSFGNLLSDAYLYGANKVNPDSLHPVDIAVIPVGFVRSTFSKGAINIEDVFQCLSIGMGPDSTSGSPLITVCLTGKELHNLAEIDATLSFFNDDAQLYFSGMKYRWDPLKLPFNRVSDIEVKTQNGTWVPACDTTIYRVACGYYAALSLISIKKDTKGLFSINPIDENGNDITDILHTRILRINNAEYKEWQALLEYMISFPIVNDLRQIPNQYSETEFRKVKKSRWDKEYTITVSLISIGATLLIYYIVSRQRKNRRRKNPYCFS